MNRRTLSLLAAASLVALAGCKTVGQQLGSTLGYAVGSQIGSGVGNYVASQSGTVIGGVIGGELATLLDEESQRRASTATGEAIVTGETQSWSNPDAGTSGQVTVVAEERKTAPVEVVVQKEQVPEPLPPIDLIGQSYVATGDANVRGGPGTGYAAVDSLSSGEVVDVVGKVRGKDWYMVSKGGVVIGYVSTSLLRVPATPQLAPQVAPAGPVVAEKVSADFTCRTAEHKVKLGSGDTASETLQACQTPQGWSTSTKSAAGTGGQAAPKPT